MSTQNEQRLDVDVSVVGLGAMGHGDQDIVAATQVFAAANPPETAALGPFNGALYQALANATGQTRR